MAIITGNHRLSEKKNIKYTSKHFLTVNLFIAYLRKLICRQLLAWIENGHEQPFFRTSQIQHTKISEIVNFQPSLNQVLCCVIQEPNFITKFIVTSFTPSCTVGCWKTSDKAIFINILGYILWQRFVDTKVMFLRFTIYYYYLGFPKLMLVCELEKRVST